jgi:putative addiction module component (TIGR02574 family)
VERAGRKSQTLSAAGDGPPFTQNVSCFVRKRRCFRETRSCVRRFLDNERGGGYYRVMSKTTDDILNNAMRLSTTERAELAAALLASLDGEPEEAVEAAWAAEIQRRVERVRSGEAKGRTWSEVRERLERRRE